MVIGLVVKKLNEMHRMDFGEGTDVIVMDCVDEVNFFGKDIDDLTVVGNECRCLGFKKSVDVFEAGDEMSELKDDKKVHFILFKGHVKKGGE